MVDLSSLMSNMALWTAAAVALGMLRLSRGARSPRVVSSQNKNVTSPSQPSSLITGAGRHERSDSAEAAQVRTAILNGKAAEDATPDDIKALTKSEYIQLFQTLPAASLEELNGEFHGEILPMGPTYLLAYYIMHWRFGPGWWQGKAFSRRDQVGYNTFFKDGHTHRRRNFDIYPGPSAYDDKQSLHLVYAKHNDGLVGQLHDELRCLNDDLFLGLGGSAEKRNPGNSTAFIICGPARPLKKSEQEYN